MNKIELLRVIDNAAFKNDTEKKRIHDKYFLAIETAVQNIPESEDLSQAIDLTNFCSFDNFWRTASAESLDRAFYELHQSLRQKSTDCHRKLTEFCIWEEEEDRKANIARIVFLVALGLLAVFVIIAAFMECKWAEIALGAIDFACGFGFFIYEQREDKKKKKERSSIEAMIKHDVSISVDDIDVKNGRLEIVGTQNNGSATKMSTHVKTAITVKKSKFDGTDITIAGSASSHTASDKTTSNH